MPHQHEITKAIGTYGLWKADLQRVVDTGRVPREFDDVRSDDRCEFGCWLASLAPEDRRDPHFAQVRDVHARFHVEAARVIELVRHGRREDAERALERGSEFEVLTTRMVMTLMDWSRAA